MEGQVFVVQGIEETCTAHIGGAAYLVEWVVGIWQDGGWVCVLVEQWNRQVQWVLHGERGGLHYSPHGNVL